MCFYPGARSYGGRKVSTAFLDNPLRPPDKLLRWQFRQAILTNMKGVGEPTFEHDFPPGSDMLSDIRDGSKAVERMEYETFSRLALHMEICYCQDCSTSVTSVLMDSSTVAVCKFRCSEWYATTIFERTFSTVQRYAIMENIHESRMWKSILIITNHMPAHFHRQILLLRKSLHLSRVQVLLTESVRSSFAAARVVMARVTCHKRGLAFTRPCSLPPHF